jgi:FMN phosphatase YigB (HAD superfamily)
VKKIFFLVKIVFIHTLLMAEVRQIDRIEAILPEIDEKTLVLFDIDETLIEPFQMLGGGSWRRYAKSLLKKTRSEEEANKIHDEITYLLSKKVPYVPVETVSVACFKRIQHLKSPLFGLTARAKDYWYDQLAPDSEELTVLHLKQAGFEFKRTKVFLNQRLFLHRSYARGIFFAYPISDKGALFLELFNHEEPLPKKVVFVDDRMKHAYSVDRALQTLGIPGVCFCYEHSERYRLFDPLIAHIQLEKFLFEDRILSDIEADVHRPQYADKDPDSFFLELISRYISKKAEGSVK